MNRGWVFLFLLSGCGIVGPQERAVSVSFGKASDEALKPGLYFWMPIVRGIKSYDVTVQKTELDSSAGTKDLQDVKTHAALNWHINPEDVVRMYKTVGDSYYIEHNIIVPAFNEVAKQATARKTAEEVLSKRDELKKEIDASLKDHLAKYGVLVDDVNIINVKFTAEFEKAVEAKQVAEQRAQQAKYEAIQAKTEAEGEVSKARGQAEAQRLLAQTVDKKVLQLKAIEKWDGHFPQVMSSGALPFINLNLGTDAQ